jgi:ABC-type branched-subunit amino acid transport system ATPase component
MADPVLLDVRDVSVRFGGVVAVDSVDVGVAPGTVVGIIGPNGAGKTTLLNAISGFVALVSGSIVLDGEDITGAPPYRRSRLGLGRSFQDARLFPGLTVREVRLGAQHPAFGSGVFSEALRLRAAREDERAAEAALERVLDLVDVRRYLEYRIAELSFGTTRAVELAWLAARQPRVLLLDEPAAGLQQSEVAVLGDLIRRIRGDAAVVVIDHDVPFVSGLVDRLVAMDLGRVVADGAVDDVLHHPDVLASYLGGSRYAGVTGGTA